ncbi:hypothetical protein TWF694_008632 [Orbilia ellipsospora]|uniref:PhoD-like phosphatase metallophosphatase domain-containing protein n=1 Tax=Orbilia ellipsospora TaxID=2528407 RepID=A0AAV9XGP1_9PEZI
MTGLLQELQLIDPKTIPHPLFERLSLTTSLAIRILTYVFIRWIPGPWIPTIVSTSFAIFVPVFLALFLSKPIFNTRSEETGITVRSQAPTENGDVRKYSNSSDGTVVVEAAKVKVFTRRKVPPWKTLAFGIPSVSDSLVTSVITFLINAFCFVAIYDATYTLPYYYKARNLSFARTGWVSENSARILIREDPLSDYVKFSPVYVVSWKEAIFPETADALAPPVRWKTTQVDSFTETTDYTVSVLLTGLKPSTKYQYLTTGNHTGSFTTAPRKTSRGKFTFLSTSCIKQRVPYSPFSHPLDIPGFKTLGRLLPILKAQFMLFLGDFIYIDVPMRPGKDAEAYRMSYRQVYASKNWPAVGEDLPWIHVYDDHEIANDWDKGDEGLYAAAVRPYKEYQHQVNPPPVRANATYYSFNWGPTSFFLLDTRRYRSPNNVRDGPQKTMLGASQLDDLLEWLRTNDRDIQWKFIVSSVPMTKNWGVNGNDTWRGFQWERSKILEAAWAVKSAGVVVLSGDRHEFAATAFPPPPGSRFPASATIHEFSCSPLSQFYLPFRTYKQKDDQDVLIKYIPDGNSKFGAIEIDSTSPDQAILKYRLFVDGEEVWDWILTKPRL